MSSTVILTNASLLTSDGLLEGSLVAEEGRIVALDGPRRSEGIDLGGALVTPGFIDLHNDGLEIEINPRPGVGLPLPVALQNFDRRAASSGVTLAYHAIMFADLASR